MRKYASILLSLIIGSVVFKVLLLLFSNYAIQPDSQGFLKNAAFFKGLDFRNLDAVFPWFYSVFIALLSFLIPNLELCGNIVSIIFSALLLVPLFYLALRIFNEKVAVLSCLLAIFYPWLNLYSFAATAETTYITMVMLAIMLGWMSWKSNSKLLYFCCGILMGLVYLTREEGIGYGTVMLFWFVLLAVKRRFRGQSGLNLILYLIPFLSLVSVFVIFLHWRTGAWVLTQQMGNVACGIDAEPASFKTRLDTINCYQYILRNFGSFVFKYLRNLRDAVKIALPDVFSPVLLVIAAIGFWGNQLSREDRNNRLYLFLFILPPFLLIPLSHIISRYFVSILPILLICLANGIEEVALRNKDTRFALLKRPVLISIVLSFLFVFSLNPVLRPIFHLLPIYEIEYKETGLWIKDNLPKNSVLFSQLGVVDYYAQRERVLVRQPGKSMYDTRSLDEILSWANQKDLNYYLVVQERWKSTTLSGLLDEKSKRKRLKPVYVNTKFPKAKVVVYEIEKTNIR